MDLRRAMEIFRLPDNYTEAELKKEFGKDFKIVVKEVKNPELSAKIMAEFVASQLESRMPFRKVAKNVLQKVMEKGAKYLQKLKEENPDKLKEYRRRAYLKRKEKLQKEIIENI